MGLILTDCWFNFW